MKFEKQDDRQRLAVSAAEEKVGIETSREEDATVNTARAYGQAGVVELFGARLEIVRLV